MIYSITISLFLKKTAFSLKKKFAIFTFGAVVTFLINILRIVTLFVIAVSGGAFERFHNFYGQLFSTTWIMSYLLIITIMSMRRPSSHLLSRVNLMFRKLKNSIK
jgi:exosortase/archaeosortase family protein